MCTFNITVVLESRFAPKNGGSLVSRVAVAKTSTKSIILPNSIHSGSRSFSRILSISGSFNHEFHEWTNDTNLFRCSIRDIRLNALFVIPKHLISHQHNSSTIRLQRELPKSQKSHSSILNGINCDFRSKIEKPHPSAALENHRSNQNQRC